MKELVLDMFRYMFGGGVFQKMTGILTMNPSDPDSSFNGAWKLVVQAYDDYIVPIGMGLMVIWFLVAFVQKATSEQMNFDQIFLLFVKLIASFYLMQNGMKIFAEIWGLGNSLVSSLGGYSGDPTVSNDALAAAWADLTGGKSWGDGTNPELPGFWRAIGAFAQLMVPWLVCAALSGVATFIAYSRLIEMMLRIAAAPIALSDFINEGLHSAGWKYIKTFFAICLQGFLILLIAKIYSSVLSAVITKGSFMELTVGFLVISFAAVALMFKTLPLCKELVGVQ